jgi:hypothetical protein
MIYTGDNDWLKTKSWMVGNFNMALLKEAEMLRLYRDGDYKASQSPV